MLKFDARKHLVAWLGLIAMLLVGLVPPVSQLIAAAHGTAPTALICGMPIAAMQGSDGHATHDKQPSPSVQGDACGYCSFFDHYTPLPTLLIVPTQFVRTALAMAVTVETGVAALRDSYPASLPRAPPAQH